MKNESNRLYVNREAHLVTRGVDNLTEKKKRGEVPVLLFHDI